jgi:hypothetical protein
MFLTSGPALHQYRQITFGQYVASFLISLSFIENVVLNL